MTAGSTWLGLAGLAIIGVLMHRQVKVRHIQPHMHATVWGRLGPTPCWVGALCQVMLQVSFTDMVRLHRAREDANMVRTV